MPNIQMLTPAASVSARGIFEHRAGQGVGVSVHRRPVATTRTTRRPPTSKANARKCRQHRRALASQGASFTNIVSFTSYLVHSQDIAKFAQFRAREFHACLRVVLSANTLLIVDRLVREEFLWRCGSRGV